MMNDRADLHGVEHEGESVVFPDVDADGRMLQ